MWQRLKCWIAHWFRVDYSGYTTPAEKHEGTWEFNYKDKQ